MDRDSPNLEGNQLHTRQVERLDELTKTDEPTPKRLKISQESDITHTNGDTNQTVREVPSKETDARLGTNNDVIDDDSLLSLNPKMLEAASETCSDLNVGDPLLNLSPELLAQLKIASEKQKALDVKHQARKRLAQATLRTNEMKAGLVREQHRLIMAELQARLEQAQTQAERNKEVHELELEYLKQQVSLSKLHSKFLAEKLNSLKTKYPSGPKIIYTTGVRAKKVTSQKLYPHLCEWSIKNHNIKKNPLNQDSHLNLSISRPD